MAENLDILNTAVSLLIRAALLTVRQNPTLVAQPRLSRSLAEPRSQIVCHDSKTPGSSQVFRRESDARSGCGTFVVSHTERKGFTIQAQDTSQRYHAIPPS